MNSTPADQRRCCFNVHSIGPFAAASLLGAFLVFQVQPVISKCVLPWFGGTPAVWTTCMLFFQVLLFAGYLYAHLLKSFFRPAAQGAIHIGLLAAAALSLPIEPSDAWKPTGGESPTIYLLWMLACHVGLPYFVLSSTGPLVQAWLSLRDESDRVYRLYALSNAGSLAALLSYPFVVEPFLSVADQSSTWSMLFLAFVLVQGFIAIGLFRVSDAVRPVTRHARPDRRTTQRTEIERGRLIGWLALPALASTLLLVVTNHVCQDVAVIPFLWVLPLSLYLISFIVCFDSPQWYRPKPIAAVTLLAIFAIETKHILPDSVRLVSEVASHMTLLLGACLLCHGEVARLKPPAAKLTLYYAMLSAGGAIGGLIVAVICPLIFDAYTELPISMAVISAFTFVLFVACQGWREGIYHWPSARRARWGIAVLVIAPVITSMISDRENTVASNRNFFGTLRVIEDDAGVSLVHGRTVHGMQRHGKDADQPTTYYGYQSGVGRVLRIANESSTSNRIGIVGLGCGVLATYGRSRDRIDLIEINPAVRRLAEQHFTFLRDCPADLHHHLGDGRLVLARMETAAFDLLVLDAFSSDAIPAHLLTTEAFDLYRGRLSADGVLAVHVSNVHLDLVPLVSKLADHAGLKSRIVHSRGDERRGLNTSVWVIIASPGSSVFDHPLMDAAEAIDAGALAKAPLWTDQYHNLASVLNIW